MRKRSLVKSIVLSGVMGVLSATTALGAPFQWTTGTGASGHWYDFVIIDSADPVISPSQAEGLAEGSIFMGEMGYLATITSAEEQAFLNGLWPGAGSVSGQFNNYSFFVIGASDRETEGVFKWIGGPEEGDTLGYTNWAPSEPNNNGGIEHYTLGWWQDSAMGQWNDAPDSPGVRGYLVEYNGDLVAPVPVPAALPLLAGGLGLMGLAGWRRKRKASAATA